MTTPASVPTNGTMSVIFVEQLAIPATPDIDEITDPSSVDLSCYLTGDGFNPSTTENTIEDPRLCQRQTFVQPGDYLDALEITYVFNPTSAPDNQAQLNIPQGTSGFLVVRWAVDSEEPWGAGDIVDVYPVTFGVQRKQQPVRNSVHRIMQTPFVTAAVERDVLVIA